MASREGSTPRVKRPFWVHQAAEYLLGLVLVAQGLQSPTPAVPSIAGGIIVLNAAITRGPLSAFRITSRAVHRVLDLVVVAVVAVLAVFPAFDVEASARLIMLAIAAMLLVVWWQSSFEEKAKRTREAITAEGGRSTEIGRMAGRAVGDTINLAKRLKDGQRPES